MEPLLVILVPGLLGGLMLMALTAKSVGLCAGQFSTQTPHPVQSSR